MKCLIVDDEPFSRDFLTTLLRGSADCHQAGSGAEAVERYRDSLASQHPFDLVIMDLVMPGMNGQEAVKAIRALEQVYLPKKPVQLVMLTGISCPPSQLSTFCQDSSALFLTKPISKDALFTIVQQLA